MGSSSTVRSHAGVTRQGSNAAATAVWHAGLAAQPARWAAGLSPRAGQAAAPARSDAQAKDHRQSDDTGAAGGGGGAPVAAAGGGAAVKPAAAKSVSVYLVSLPGATRDADADVKRANTIWAQASLGIAVKGGESWNTDLMDQLDPKGVLNEFSDPSAPTAEEQTLIAHQPGGAVIHAYFVPEMSDGSRGEGFLRADVSNGAGAVVVSDSAAVDTFAHELGHVLLNDGGHHADPDNLMASGTIRNVGVDKLDAAQIAKV